MAAKGPEKGTFLPPSLLNKVPETLPECEYEALFCSGVFVNFGAGKEPVINGLLFREPDYIK